VNGRTRTYNTFQNPFTIHTINAAHATDVYKQKKEAQKLHNN